MESAFKVKADGWLVKKIIALVRKWDCASLPRRGWVSMGVSEQWRREVRSAERMMGSDSGLSRGTGCPEKCEATAMRWQERAGCQSKKVALMRQKGKESACQSRSAKPRRSSAMRKEQKWRSGMGKRKVERKNKA